MLGETIVMDRIHFECQRCGRCCTRRGDLRVTPMDLVRYCRFLNISVSEFFEKYTVIMENESEDLPIVLLKDKGDKMKTCIFFEEGVGCKVHLVKPPTCYLYPFLVDIFEVEKTQVLMTPCVIIGMSGEPKEKIGDVIKRISTGRYQSEKNDIKCYINLIGDLHMNLQRNSQSKKQKQAYIHKFFEDFFTNLDISDDKYLSTKLKEWDDIVCFI